jgi:hypothetical protein
MKISRCTQVADGGTGVRTFIPYALPATFDITPPALIFSGAKHYRRARAAATMQLKASRRELYTIAAAMIV